MSHSVASISIRQSSVPVYLCSSEFYRSFEDGDDEEILIPADCLKSDTRINSVADFEHLLRTMRFWILSAFPVELIEFLLGVGYAAYGEEKAEMKSIMSELRPFFPGAFELIGEINAHHNAFVSYNACNLSAKYGRIDFLEYFKSLGKRITVKTFVTAAVHGHLPCLRYIHSLFKAQGKDVCYQLGCRKVVQYGQLECLKVLHQNGASVVESYCCVAIESGHMHCLQYLLRALNVKDEFVTVVAVQSGDVSMLRCVVDHGCVVGSDAWAEAVQSTDTVSLDYLLTLPAQLDSAEMLQVVAYACTPALMLLHQRGHTFSADLVAEAAKTGNIECLEFLHQHLHYNYLVPTTMAAAAAAGQLELCVALHQQGCEWDESAPLAALHAHEPWCLNYFLELRGVPHIIANTPQPQGNEQWWTVLNTHLFRRQEIDEMKTIMLTLLQNSMQLGHALEKGLHDGRHECPHCARRFDHDSLTVHVNVCERVFLKKRKVFDSAQRRMKGHSMVSTVDKGAAKSG